MAIDNFSAHFFSSFYHHRQVLVWRTFWPLLGFNRLSFGFTFSSHALAEELRNYYTYFIFKFSADIYCLSKNADSSN